jgi:hypothetical protein
VSLLLKQNSSVLGLVRTKHFIASIKRFFPAEPLTRISIQNNTWMHQTFTDMIDKDDLQFS